MTEQLELDLSFTQNNEDIPDSFFQGVNQDEDRRHPVETICHPTCNRIQVHLRCIDDMWIWGVTIHGNNGGMGFYPFRKWGRKHVSTSRDLALSAAFSYASLRLPEYMK